MGAFCVVKCVCVCVVLVLERRGEEEGGTFIFHEKPHHPVLGQPTSSCTRT